MTRRPAAFLLVSAILGAFFGDIASPQICALLAFFAILLALVPRILAKIIAFLLFVGLVTAWSFAHQKAKYEATVAQIPEEGRFFGTILDSMARDDGQRLVLVEASTEAGFACNLLVHAKEANAALPLSPGTQVTFFGRTQIFAKPLSDSLFDARRYGFLHNLHASITLTHPSQIFIHSSRAPKYFADLRARIRSNILQALTPQEASMLLALMLGDTSLLSTYDREVFQNIGAQHLLAVSGLQISLFAWLCLLLLFPLISLLMPTRLIQYARALTALCALCATFWFVGLTGFSISAVRAFLMASVMMLPTIIVRRIDAYDAFFCAGLFTMLWWPTSIYDVGFWLSYAAVFGLLVANMFGNKAAKLLAQRSWWLSAGTRLAIATIAVFLFTLPVIALTLHNIAPFTLLANFALVPFASIMQIPAILLGLTGSLSNSAVLIKLASWFVNLIVVLADAFAQIFPGLVYLPSLAPFTVLALGGTLFALVYFVRTRARFSLVVALGCAMLPLIGMHKDRLIVTVIPVGQGDATLFSLPSGENLVIDAGGVAFGTYDPGLSVVVPTLRKKGIHHIDVLVISHPDPDHLMGAFALLDAFLVKEIWHSGFSPEHPLTKRLVAKARAKNIPMKTTRDIFGNHHFGATTVSVIAPLDEDFYPELSANNNSLVVRISHGKHSLLWPGDLELMGEYLLLSSGIDVSATILKAPHNGSKTSSSVSLVTAIHPEHVIYSTGAGNRFGFPHDEVVQRYQQLGTKEWNTATDGEITISLSPDDFSINGYQSAFKEKT